VNFRKITSRNFPGWLRQCKAVKQALHMWLHFPRLDHSINFSLQHQCGYLSNLGHLRSFLTFAWQDWGKPKKNLVEISSAFDKISENKSSIILSWSKISKWSLSRRFRSLKIQCYVHSIQITHPVHNLCVLTTLTALFNSEFLINFCICILQQIACGSWNFTASVGRVTGCLEVEADKHSRYCQIQNCHTNYTSLCRLPL
jgi:hypothetical protein